jgi:hypothetical protein
MAIASVQSICFFERRPIVKTAVKALNPIFRIWLLVGWLILAKGLLLLCVAPEAIAGLIGRMRYGESYYLSLVPAFLLGLYLTWAGLAAQASRRL